MPNRSGGQGDNPRQRGGRRGLDNTNVPPQPPDVTRRAYGGPEKKSGGAPPVHDHIRLQWQPPMMPENFQGGKTSRPPAQGDRSGSQGEPASRSPRPDGVLQRLRDARRDVSSSSRGPEGGQAAPLAPSSDGSTTSSPSDSGVFSASDHSAPVSPDLPRTHERAGNNPHTSKRRKLREDSLPPRESRERDYAERLQEALTQLIQEQSKEVGEQLTRHASEESSQPDNIDLVRKHMRENQQLEEQQLSARETKEREHLTRYQRSEHAPDAQGSETKEFHDMKWSHLEQYYNLERSLSRDKYARLETRLNVGDSVERAHFTALIREHNKKEYDLLIDQLIERQNQEKTHLEQRQGKNQNGMPALAFRQIEEREELAYKQLDQRKTLEFGFQQQQHDADCLFHPDAPGQSEDHKRDEEGLLQYYEMQGENLKSTYDKEKVPYSREKLKKDRELEEQRLSARETREKEQLSRDQQSTCDITSEGIETKEVHDMEMDHIKGRYELERVLLERKYERLEDVLKKQDPSERERFTHLMREYDTEEYGLFMDQLNEAQRQEKEHLEQRSIQTQESWSAVVFRQIEERERLAYEQIDQREALELAFQERKYQAASMFRPNASEPRQSHKIDQKYLRQDYIIQKDYLRNKYGLEKKFQTREDSTEEKEKMRLYNKYSLEEYRMKKKNYLDKKEMEYSYLNDFYSSNPNGKDREYRRGHIELDEQLERLDKQLAESLKKLKDQYLQILRGVRSS